MIKVYTDGLYHYEIVGDREKGAADEMKVKLDLLSRSHYGGESYIEELSDLRHSISEKYNVEISVEL